MGQTWLEALTDEERTFVKNFVLASGSLKAVAEVYGISYPTVRLRLDRLIQKLQLLESGEELGPFEQQLRMLYVEGRLDMSTVKLLREAYGRERKESR
ncbi:MAG: DUF2089 family protein [Candidatus Schekmanbacteria bacterium]|nr:DUF2089 family protein [Candidatus Schekmanbacteria bacterium]